MVKKREDEEELENELNEIEYVQTELVKVLIVINKLEIPSRILNKNMKQYDLVFLFVFL